MSFQSTFIPVGRARASGGASGGAGAGAGGGAGFESTLLAATTRLEPATEAEGAGRTERSAARLLARGVAFWALVGLAEALLDGLDLQAAGRPVEAIGVLRGALAGSLLWAALTPGVFWLARRVPLEARGLPSALALHGLAGLAFAFLHGALAGAVMAMSGGTGASLAQRLPHELLPDLWIYGSLVLVRALLDARRRERERAAQAARLQDVASGLKMTVLRAQVQPRFVVDTLQAIATLLRVEPRAAEDILADLGEFLRTSCIAPTTRETTLRRELDVVGCYLRIQQRRLGARLNVALDVDLDTLDAAVPALVLQSLVENAVEHGLARLARAGTLWIGARRAGTLLEVDVRDDGVGGLGAGSRDGAGPGSGGDAEAGRDGQGLAPARERLRHLYGEAQSFVLEHPAGQGTRVTLRFPYRLGTEAAG